MLYEDIKQKAKCCITGWPLKDSAHINAIQLDVPATWKYPVMGNVLQGIFNIAVAFIHDEAINPDGSFVGPIKHAIEFSNGEVIYHDLEQLRKNQHSCATSQEKN